MDIGVSLYAAHYLTIGRRNELAAQRGGVTGNVEGPKSAKAVDKVSASMDTKAVTIENAGFYNLSVYGIQLFQLARYVGAGPVQVNGGGSPGFGPWTGPPGPRC